MNQSKTSKTAYGSKISLEYLYTLCVRTYFWKE